MVKLPTPPHPNNVRRWERPTSDVVVCHSDLGDDVCALGEAGLDETLVLLQGLFDHLQLRVDVGHEEVLDPAVRERQGLQL